MKILTWSVDVKSEELKILLLLCLCSFFKGASVLYLETASTVLFLGSHEISVLPYTYLFIALFSVITGIIYTFFKKRIKFLFLIIGVQLLLTISIFLFYFSVGIFDKKFISFLMMIWKDVNYIFSEISFWSVVGILFTTEQGKRLFGLLIASEVLADIIGGFTMPVITKFLSIDDLIFVSLFFVVLSSFILSFIVFKLGFFINHSCENQPLSRSFSIREYWSNKYLRMLMLFSIISVFCYYFMDYIFYEEAGRMFSSEEKTASFFGLYFGVLGVVNFLVSLLLSGRLLLRWGVYFGMLASPLVLVFGTLFVGMSSFFVHIAGLLFGVIVLVKILYDIAIYTIETPTRKILYQPFKITHRLQVQGVLESIIEPIAGAVVAALLIVLTSFLSFESHHLFFVLFSFVLLWVFVCFSLHKEYRSATNDKKNLGELRRGSEVYSLDTH